MPTSHDVSIAWPTTSSTAHSHATVGRARAQLGRTTVPHLLSAAPRRAADRPCVPSGTTSHFPLIVRLRRATHADVYRTATATVPRHRRVCATDHRPLAHDTCSAGAGRYVAPRTGLIRASSSSAWRRPPPTDRAIQKHVSTVSLRTCRPTPSPRLRPATDHRPPGTWHV